MLVKEIEILLPGGLHILNVNHLRELIDSSESAVFMTFKGQTVNCRDPISVLALRIHYGDSVKIHCDGIDEVEILNLITKFLENKK